MIENTHLSENDWKSFEARLQTYVRSRADPQWVDDIVGDILLSLVRHRDRLQEAANPLAYVQRVATNALTDHYRRRARERRALERVKREPSDIDDDTAAETAPDTEISKCLLPFIGKLPGRYRDALMATEIVGLTQAEAAQQLGLSVSGLKSRVQRGREKLKHSLLRCCAIETDRRGAVVEFTRRKPGCG